KRCNTGDGTMYTAANVKFSGESGIIVGVARYDARVVFPTNRAVKSIAVEDYANNRDWLQYVRLNGAAMTPVQRWHAVLSWPEHNNDARVVPSLSQCRT